jgi:hypothetical protein
VYPSTSYLSLHYGGETLLLELAVFDLYSIPIPIIPLVEVKVVKEEEKSTLSGADYRGY